MKKTLSLILIAAGFAASAANAAVTTYTSSSAWSTALGSTFSIENFNDSTLNPGLTITSDAGTISGGFFNDRVVNGGAKTTFSFSNAITGFGGNWDLTPGDFGQGLDFFSNNVLVGSIADLSGSFYGFISTTGFNSVVVRGGTQPGGLAESYKLDNLVYGGTVPEPTTVALLGLGLLGVVASRRKSTKK